MTEFVISELLCFVASKLNYLKFEDVFDICIKFYKDEEISVARSMLFDRDLLPEERYPRRRVNSSNRSKTECELDDILKCVIEHDANEEIMPVFCAKNLTRLPNTFEDKVFMEIMDLKQDVFKLKGLEKHIHDLKDYISFCLDSLVSHQYRQPMSFTEHERPRMNDFVNVGKQSVDIDFPGILNENLMNGEIAHQLNSKGAHVASDKCENNMVASSASCDSQDTMRKLPVPDMTFAEVASLAPQLSEDAGFQIVGANGRAKRNDNVPSGRQNRKRFAPPLSVGTLNTPSLKGCQRTKSMYVGRLDNNTTEDSLRKHIGTRLMCRILEINRVDDGNGNFASFHVEIFASDVNTFIRGDLWPEFVEVRYFRNLKRWKELHQ